MRLQDSIDWDRTHAGQAITRLPIIRGNRQRPEQNADVALRPSLMQTPPEIVEVDAPHGGMEQEGLQGLSSGILENLTSDRCDFQAALVLPHQSN